MINLNSITQEQVLQTVCYIIVFLVLGALAFVEVIRESNKDALKEPQNPCENCAAKSYCEDKDKDPQCEGI